MNTSMSLVAASALAGLLGGLSMQPAGQTVPDGGEKAQQPAVPSGHPQIPLPRVAETWPKAKAEDVSSVDAIVGAFYSAAAGAPGEARDWDRFRSLFVPEARMIPARTGPQGAAGTIFLSIADYIDANKTYFEKGGFSDREIGRRTETFGNMVHVWSTYESRRRAEDPAPYSRGINSLQLLKDGPRYWIVNVFWDHERADAPIPDKYTLKSKE